MRSLDFLKNYFLLFFLSYGIIILSKFIFAFYLHDNFTTYSFQSLFEYLQEK